MPNSITLNNASQFFENIRNPFRFRMFLLSSLPAAFFAGLRIVSVTESVCTVSVPYKWFNKSPFGSTYFACQSMAAELSTGVLVMAQVWRRNPPVSMLITSMEAKFYKKATGTVLFTCNAGDAIKAAVTTAIETGAAQTIKVQTDGFNLQGQPIASFWFEWSFKQKEMLN